MLQHQVHEILADQLRESDQSIGNFLGAMQRDLLRMTELSQVDSAELRDIARTEPRVSQVFAIDREGRLLHPPIEAGISVAEREFIQRARPFLVDKDLVRDRSIGDDSAGDDNVGDDLMHEAPVEQSIAGDSAGNADERNPAATQSEPTSGWYAWYWGRGLNLIFWRRLKGGEVVGIELNRARWISELIAHLPKSPIDPADERDWQIRLVDSSSNSVYQWGGYDPTKETEAFAEIPLSSPLTSWRLRYFVARDRFDALAGRSAYFNSFAGIAVASLGLIALVVFLYRESARDLHEAKTRVSFVNQVSHELKTPLTNIRMYAELLEQDLQSQPFEAVGPIRERLEVIVGESRRLSRLIGNVLTFSSQQRQQLVPRRRSGRLDEIVRSVIHRFQPSLSGKGIEVEFDGGISDEVDFDSDFVEQILVNLLSNAEKYGAAGKWLGIRTRRSGQTCMIRVADRGPGIPLPDRERIFQPFCRADERLESSAGTGIGLAISRNLARLHGGDLIIVDSEHGAVFEVQLLAPLKSKKE